MKKYAKWLMNVFIVLVFFVLIFFFLAPQLGGIDLYTITSGSMSPEIPVASVVIVKPVTATDIEVGDVITFNAATIEERVVTHRVVEVMADGDALSFRTAGDANGHPDGTIVLAEDVVGRVWFQVPYLGYLASFVNTKLGFIWVVIVPSCCIILLEVRNIVKEMRLSRKPLQGQMVPVAMGAESVDDGSYQEFSYQDQYIDTYMLNSQAEMTDAGAKLSLEDNVSTDQIKPVDDVLTEPVLIPDGIKDYIRVENGELTAVTAESTGQDKVALLTTSDAEELNSKRETLTTDNATSSKDSVGIKVDPDIHAEAVRIVAEIATRVQQSKE